MDNLNIDILFSKIKDLSDKKFLCGEKIHVCDKSNKYHNMTIVYTDTETTTYRDLIKNKQIFKVYAVDIDCIKTSKLSIFRKRMFNLSNLLSSNDSTEKIIDLLNHGLPTLTVDFRFPKETILSSSSSSSLQITVDYNKIINFAPYNPKTFASWGEHENYPGNLCQIEIMKLLTQHLGKEFLDIAFCGYNYDLEYFKTSDQLDKNLFGQNKEAYYKTFKNDLCEYENEI